MTFFGPSKDFISPEKTNKLSASSKVNLNATSFNESSQSNKRHISEITNLESQVANRGSSSSSARKGAGKSKASAISE